jgi:hypothetical protein
MIASTSALWRVDACDLAVFDGRGDHGPVVSALVRTSEKGVLSIECDRADRVFDGVAVEIDAAGGRQIGRLHREEDGPTM